MTSCNNKLNFYATSWPEAPPGPRHLRNPGGGGGPLDGGRGVMPGAEAFLSLSARATHLQLRSGDWQGSAS